jgi:hypothetical protein
VHGPGRHRTCGARPGRHSEFDRSDDDAPADSETRVVGLVIDAVKSGRRVRIDVEIDKAE